MLNFVGEDGLHVMETMGHPRSSEVSDSLEVLLSSVTTVWFILAALLEDN